MLNLDKSLVTKKAKQEMIDIHSQKLIKAWLDVDQYTEKEASLQADFDLLSDDNKKRVEAFMEKRIANPQGDMLPEGDIAQAVAIKMGLDTMSGEKRKAKMEFEFFTKVIGQLKTLKAS